jgi:hypothetical protein
MRTNSAIQIKMAGVCGEHTYKRAGGNWLERESSQVQVAQHSLLKWRTPPTGRKIQFLILSGNSDNASGKNRAIFAP